MSDVEPRHRAPLDGLLRTLADYTDKLAVANREIGRARTNAAVVMLAVYTALYFGIGRGASFWAILALGAVVGVLVGLVARFWSRGLITDVQLAAWRLRQVYELASRMEDMDMALEPVQRLELELRLGEAQFLLNRVERWGQPSSKAARMVLRQRAEKPIAAAEPSPAVASTSDDSKPPSA